MTTGRWQVLHVFRGEQTHYQPPRSDRLEPHAQGGLMLFAQQIAQRIRPGKFSSTRKHVAAPLRLTLRYSVALACSISFLLLLASFA